MTVSTYCTIRLSDASIQTPSSEIGFMLCVIQTPSSEIGCTLCVIQTPSEIGFTLCVIQTPSSDCYIYNKGSLWRSRRTLLLASDSLIVQYVETVITDFFVNLLILKILLTEI
jgi:hypothetical protein